MPRISFPGYHSVYLSTTTNDCVDCKVEAGIYNTKNSMYTTIINNGLTFYYNHYKGRNNGFSTPSVSLSGDKYGIYYPLDLANLPTSSDPYTINSTLNTTSQYVIPLENNIDRTPTYYPSLKLNPSIKPINQSPIFPVTTSADQANVSRSNWHYNLEVSVTDVPSPSVVNTAQSFKIKVPNLGSLDRLMQTTHATYDTRYYNPVVALLYKDSNDKFQNGFTADPDINDPSKSTWVSNVGVYTSTTHSTAEITIYDKVPFVIDTIYPIIITSIVVTLSYIDKNNILINPLGNPELYSLMYLRDGQGDHFIDKEIRAATNVFWRSGSGLGKFRIYSSTTFTSSGDSHGGWLYLSEYIWEDQTSGQSPNWTINEILTTDNFAATGRKFYKLFTCPFTSIITDSAEISTNLTWYYGKDANKFFGTTDRNRGDPADQSILKIVPICRSSGHSY